MAKQMTTNHPAVEIRRLRRDDAAAWRDLHIHGVMHFPLGFLVTPEEARAMTLVEATGRLTNGHYVGAFSGEWLVGFCGLGLRALAQTRHSAEIGPFYVHPDYQGRGVATAILAELSTMASGAGVERLELNVDTKNHRAIGFYERAGFRKVATIPDGVRINGVSRDDHLYYLNL